jgi:hypothetical protein
MNICKTIGKIMVLGGVVLSIFAIFCHFKLSNRVSPFINLVLLMIAVADILLGGAFMLAQKVGKYWWLSGADLESRKRGYQILSKPNRDHDETIAP